MPATFRERDLNRFRKTYPQHRRRKHVSIVPLTDNFILEIGSVTFSGQDSVVHSFTVPFTSTPTVTAISVDSLGNNQANVNVWVESLSTTTARFRTSAAFSGVIHFHAIQMS